MTASNIFLYNLLIIYLFLYR